MMIQPIRRSPLVLLTTLLATVALAGPAGAAPPCVTASSSDRANVPCNPYLADSAYPMAHTNPYSQHSTSIAGPKAGDKVQVRHRAIPGIAIAAFFSPSYRDGRRVAWMHSITTTTAGFVYKVDTSSGNIIAEYDSITREGIVPERTSAVGGVYSVVDRDNHFIHANGPSLDVLGDDWPRSPGSSIRLLRRFTLPARARCRHGDYIVGVNMLWDGRVVFVTSQGILGIVPREPKRMTNDELVITSLNGDRCSDARVPTSALETVSNSLSVDESGGVYLVSNKAQYRFNVKGTTVKRAWRVAYGTGNSGGTGGSVRLDSGSGTTPTLMGTTKDKNQFVVITDGRELMHLTLMWRGKIPANWRGLPGRPRRIACELPVTFGDPNATSSQSENAVVVRGRSMYIPNNQLRNMEAFKGVTDPTLSVVVAGLVGQSPANAPHGFERVDWNPKTRTCEVVWVNKEASWPSGVPYVSSGSDMVYGIGQRNGVWGLEGLDNRTGAATVWIPSGPLPTQGPFYSAVNVDDAGNAWTGGIGGFTSFVTNPGIPLPIG